MRLLIVLGDDLPPHYSERNILQFQYESPMSLLHNWEWFWFLSFLDFQEPQEDLFPKIHRKTVQVVIFGLFITFYRYGD